MRDLFAARYDIIAKAEHEVPKDQLALMLQTLLADRFKLTLHRENKLQPVYKLVIAKGGPKLRESQGPQTRDPNCAPPKCMAFNNTDIWSSQGSWRTGWAVRCWILPDFRAPGISLCGWTWTG